MITTATTPNDPTHLTVVTNQSSPSGTGVTTPIRAFSLDGLTLVANQQSRITRSERPTRTPSLPRRRVCPSPIGANRIARHVVPDHRRCRGGVPGASAAGAPTSVSRRDSTVTSTAVSCGGPVAPSPIRAEDTSSDPTP